MFGERKNLRIKSFLAVAAVSITCLLPLAASAECIVEGWGETCGCDPVAAGDACKPAGAERPGTCTLSGAELRCVEPAAAPAADADAPTAPPANRDLVNPLGEDVSLQEVFARILTFFTAISGSLALLMFVYGGVLWLTSGGETGRIETGKKAITWSVIGLLVIFGAYAMLRVIFVTLGGGGIL
ncbi:hypothetical protein COY93_03630 [Candidatus Uhrbacteria bacterium CG_4_10_14_0_8_um_filter_58_22]|uniref:Uncharacterized protein n=1 Tax=Candidatus Uhrbacteria bacterium CG_4_10_14_0_8_um_filter_58_22 TaxID=1975029 RepID=A0A2M7Q9A9_9BACT|nr:MAG: hypothetical protein AUJ19_02605 [Parcubacteria group bacterium CG1_02_58_44]PIY62180.1 MAG: hypothetical protein COY93_03630 [Candidatus Uhrbacteria bacterium CG_4_10_14_0_8_um_filter_58_22]